MESDLVELVGKTAVSSLTAQASKALSKRLRDRLRFRLTRKLGESFSQLFCLRIPDVQRHGRTV